MIIINKITAAKIWVTNTHKFGNKLLITSSLVIGEQPVVKTIGKITNKLVIDDNNLTTFFIYYYATKINNIATINE